MCIYIYRDIQQLEHPNSVGKMILFGGSAFGVGEVRLALGRCVWRWGVRLALGRCVWRWGGAFGAGVPNHDGLTTDL